VKCCLLDSSFVIDLLNELAESEPGPAVEWLRRNPSARLWISPVTWAEVLEGADDPAAVRAYLGRYQWQGIGRAHADKVSEIQRRNAKRMGENDAWQAAVAAGMHGTLVGHDRRAFERLGAGYDDFKKSGIQ